MLYPKATPPAIASEPTGPTIVALDGRVTEEILLELAREHPEYRFEATADGRLIVSRW